MRDGNLASSQGLDGCGFIEVIGSCEEIAL